VGDAAERDRGGGGRAPVSAGEAGTLLSNYSAK